MLCTQHRSQARKLLVLSAARALTLDESASFALKADPLSAVLLQQRENFAVPARRGIVEAPARRVPVLRRLLGVDVRLRLDLRSKSPPPLTMTHNKPKHDPPQLNHDPQPAQP